MNYAKIKKTDVANGKGIRVSLFVSGCTRGCKGCFNREAWDFACGKPWDEVAERELMEALAPAYIRGLSVLGGEPFEPQNAGTVAEIIEHVRARFPQKDIWCYTGGVYESELCVREKTEPAVARILDNIDVLVDGPYIEELRNLRLQIRGAENQRILDLRKLRGNAKIIQ